MGKSKVSILRNAINLRLYSVKSNADFFKNSMRPDWILSGDWKKNGWDQQYASVKQASTYAGKQYSAPLGYDAYGFFYRKDLFCNPTERQNFQKQYHRPLPCYYNEWEDVDWNDWENIGKGPPKAIPENLRTHKKLHASMLALHEKFYAEAGPDDMLKPMIMIVCKNGDVVPIIARMSTPEEKDAFADDMTASFKKWKVTHYAFVMEAWMRYTNQQEYDEAGGDMANMKAPSASPDRIEVVHTFAQNQRGQVMASLQKIVRGEDGRVLKLELMNMTERDAPPEIVDTEANPMLGFAGRFADLLRPEPNA